MILIYYSDMLIELLKATKGKELEFTYIMFPIILIFNMTITLGKLVINGAFDKKVKK